MRRQLTAVVMVLFVMCPPVAVRGVFADDVFVMTSGAFTAAYLELAPMCERGMNEHLVTATTTMGTGADAIPARLARGEAADVVIVAADALDDLVHSHLVVEGSRVDLARSSIAMAVRTGARKPDISTVDTLKQTLLDATSVAYSASVSGDYLVQELFPRLGIAEQMRGKSRRIERERVGAVVARGEAEIGFQQVSELLPIPGIDLVGRLPSGVQRVTVFSAGVAAHSKHIAAAQTLIRCLSSTVAADVAAKTGLEPIRHP